MSNTRNRTNGTILLAVTGLLVMLTAAPAFAGHEEALRREAHGQSCDTHGRYWCGIEGCNDAHVRPGLCFAKREYDRGQDLACRDGNDRGYRDAALCRPFCDGIPRHLDRFSKFFARGYVDAYRGAYKAAFDRYRQPARGSGWSIGIGNDHREPARGGAWAHAGRGWSWGRSRGHGRSRGR